MVNQPVVQYPALTEPIPLDPSLQVPPVFAESWVQPWSELVLPIEYRYLLDSVFGQPLEDGLVAAFSTFGWEMQPQFQPVLARELRYLNISTFAQIEPGDFVVPPVSDEVAPTIVRIGAYGLLHGAGKTPIGRGF